MIMKTLTPYDMKKDLVELGRNYFSLEALGAFDDFLEEIGESWEWDPIALCCEWSEECWQDIAANYDIDLSESCDDAETVYNFLNENTIAFRLSGGCFMYQNF